MLVVGDKEQEQTGVSVRRHGDGDLGLMPIAAAAETILDGNRECIGSSSRR